MIKSRDKRWVNWRVLRLRRDKQAREEGRQVGQADASK
jgi:hypothetical protein